MGGISSLPKHVIPYPTAQYPWTGQLRGSQGRWWIYNNCFLSEAGGWESLTFHLKRRWNHSCTAPTVKSAPLQCWLLVLQLRLWTQKVPCARDNDCSGCRDDSFFPIFLGVGRPVLTLLILPPLCVIPTIPMEFLIPLSAHDHQTWSLSEVRVWFPWGKYSLKGWAGNSSWSWGEIGALLGMSSWSLSLVPAPETFGTRVFDMTTKWSLPNMVVTVVSTCKTF